MKKIVPFIFPLFALLIVIALLYRWYILRTNRPGQLTESAQTTEQSLPFPEDNGPKNGAQDLKSVQFKSTATDSSTLSQGTLRYEVTQNNVNFTVTAALPEPTTGHYQVWMRNKSGIVKGSALEPGKGGWIASGGVAKDQLPLEIVISLETNDDNSMEKIVLIAHLEPGQ